MDQRTASLPEESPSLAFLGIIESGRLEHEVRLLVQSIREFSGPFSQCPVYVVQPRAGPPPSKTTLNLLGQLGAIYVKADLNKSSEGKPQPGHKCYALINKPHAASLVESMLVDKVEFLALLDSDTLLLNSPSEFLLEAGCQVAVRPVDRGVICPNFQEPLTPFWEQVYRVCDVNPDQVWELVSTVDQKRIRAYFNSGTVVVRPRKGLFKRWKENVERFLPSELDPNICGTEREKIFVEQAFLTGTILSTIPKESIKILSATYNYPLHNQRSLPPSVRLADFSEIVTVHYHKALRDDVWMDTIRVSPEYQTWLKVHGKALKRRLGFLNSLRRHLRHYLRKSSFASASLLS
jgi:hypothetical protein